MAAMADHPIASLSVDGAVGSVVPGDARFRLTSIDGTSATLLAKRLTVTPALDLRTIADDADHAVTLVPKGALLPGVVYRFALSGSSGELVDTWAFQAHQPLRVVQTLPANEQTDVPLDTGIEVTFDQDGVGEVASHVTIDPPTPGRFEAHGRTVAFVPDRPLTAKTLYTVTMTKGVLVPDTGETSQVDTRFAFETGATTGATDEPVLGFTDDVIESATAERQVLGFWILGDETRAPTTMKVEVFKLADVSAGIDAFRTIRTRPEWARWSTRGLVDTSGLTHAITFVAPLNSLNEARWIELPERLPAGWYLVQLDAARPSQAVLQVTDLAAYLAVSTTRTLVWANDLATRRAVANAAVEANGTKLGRTDAQGLIIGKTPSSLLPQAGQRCDRPCDPVVTVRTADGRAVFLPASTAHDKLEWIDGSLIWGEADSTFWTILHTDRNRYRSTDTLNVWGLARGRDDGRIPASVSVRLTAIVEDGGNERPAIATIAATPKATGAFLASIPLAALPEGPYSVEMVVGGRVVRSVGISVGPIAKPAYQLDVTTGHRIYVAGDRIKITVDATFFEGTPVPGLPLRIGGDTEAGITTNPDGTAVATLTAKQEEDQQGPSYRTVDVSPARAEEGEIAGASREYIVFPSTRTVNGVATLSGRRVVVNGSVHVLARDRLEAEVSAGHNIWDLDPNGPAVSGANVTVRFVELIPVRREAGTEYDFINKKVVPIIETDIVARDAGTIQARTAANGSFKVALPNAVVEHSYQVTLSVGDSDGHIARLSLAASAEVAPTEKGNSASLWLTDPTATENRSYGIGDKVDVTMSGTGIAGGGRYLFYMAHEGIRSATIQASPRFITPFASWAVPNVDISAVRFTGRGFTAAVYDASFRLADRRLDVRLSRGAARYAPGGRATIGIRTLDSNGKPVSATVVLQAVDEKLFSIGAAEGTDPLAELYATLPSGMVGSYSSHHPPAPSAEGGDTTGGGGDDRDDFRDSLLFEAVTTGSDGRGSVSFDLSDDLTSWRVSASAVSRSLQAGSSTILVPVGLPFFVDASIAPEYLVADRPAVSVRTFGSALTPGAPVTIKVTSPSLGFTSPTIKTTAFASVDVPLPPLKAGVQTVTITASSGSGSTARTDRLTRTFRVVESRLSRSVSSLTQLTTSGAASLPAGSLPGGAGLTTIAVSDAGAAAYLPLLQDLSADGGARFERGYAADIAGSLLVGRFGFSRDSLEPSTFAAARYQGPDGGLAILPYATSDLEVSAFAALVDPDKVDRARLASYLRTIHAGRDETRERKIIAAAGLAGLGDPVLPELQRYAIDPALTIRERLLVGIGAAAAGDAATARSIAGSLIAANGERLGAVARLRVGSDVVDTATATGLMAILAARIGDDRASLFWAYVASNPDRERLDSVAGIAYAAASLERLASEPARFAWTVDGQRHVVDLKTQRGFQLALTPAQLSTLTIDRVSGSISVLASWREAADRSAFDPDPDVTITRVVRPSIVDASDLVRVDLTVTFGPRATSGCHDVTDLLPSGLTPVGPSAAWVDPDSSEPRSPYVSPYEQSTSSVRFCAEPTASGRTVDLRYFARAVTTGMYAWEPAVVESTTEAGHGSLTPPSTLTIR